MRAIQQNVHIWVILKDGHLWYLQLACKEKRFIKKIEDNQASPPIPDIQG